MFFMKKETGQGTFTIFFDVDGVLNKESEWSHRTALNKDCLDAFQELFTLLRKKGYQKVEAVIISTWRGGRSGKGESGSDAPQYQALERELSKRGIEIAGATPITEKGRQAEVEYYIRRNEVEDYVILDDDRSLFEAPERLELYSPDYRTGLTRQDAKAIVKKI